MNLALPLLALPGLLNDERLWQNQAADLRPDHPLTSFAQASHGSIAELALAALARAPAQRFALAGFSMGGYVALEIMRQAPERVVALALLDTNARPDSAQATEGRRSAIAQSATDFEAVLAGMVGKFFHPSRVDDKPLVDLFKSMARGIGRDGFVRQQQAIIDRVDSRPTLAQIRCPTLVLCGRDDTLTPLDLSKEMAAAIAGAQLVVVDDCAHMSPLERPAEVSQALRTWLSAIGRPAR